MTLKLNNATFYYDSSAIIFDQINFSINKGEIWGILGPNGCGKTTLLKCLNGLFKLKSGNILIEDRNLNSLKINEIGRKIGYVPQIADTTFPYTVLEMVLMGRSSHLGVFSSPSKKDMQTATEIIERLGISHLTNKPYPCISGGEAQLVLIARALTAEPVVLLLDEPTSHLDFKNQNVILNILEKLSIEKNLAVIMTTHFPDHALSICNKALLMGNGKNSMMGSTLDVLTECNLRDVFGIDVKIMSFDIGENNIKTVIPLR